MTYNQVWPSTTISNSLRKSIYTQNYTLCLATVKSQGFSPNSFNTTIKQSHLQLVNSTDLNSCIYNITNSTIMDYSYNLIVVHTLLHRNRKMFYIGAGQSIFICPAWEWLSTTLYDRGPSKKAKTVGVSKYIAMHTYLCRHNLCH